MQIAFANFGHVLAGCPIFAFEEPPTLPSSFGHGRATYHNTYLSRLHREAFLGAPLSDRDDVHHGSQICRFRASLLNYVSVTDWLILTVSSQPWWEKSPGASDQSGLSTRGRLWPSRATFQSSTS
jgi:hypothetical protein